MNELWMPPATATLHLSALGYISCAMALFASTLDSPRLVCGFIAIVEVYDGLPANSCLQQRSRVNFQVTGDYSQMTIPHRNRAT